MAGSEKNCIDAGKILADYELLPPGLTLFTHLGSRTDSPYLGFYAQNPEKFHRVVSKSSLTKSPVSRKNWDEQQTKEPKMPRKSRSKPVFLCSPP